MLNLLRLIRDAVGSLDRVARVVKVLGFVASAPGMFKKLCKVLNLDFESGDVSAESLIGKNVFVKVKIQKDEKGQFDDKNVIAAFADKLPEGVQTQAVKLEDEPF